MTVVGESGEAGEGRVTRVFVGHSTGLGFHPACSKQLELDPVFSAEELSLPVGSLKPSRVLPRKSDPPELSRVLPP